MTTALTPMQSFEQNIKDRLTADIGSLIPDEALVTLVSRAVEDVFFQPTTKQVKDRYGDFRTVSVPAVFPELVKDLLKDRMDACIAAFLEKNKDQVIATMHDIVERDANQVVIQALSAMFSKPLETFKRDLNQKFGENNLPQVY